MVPTTSLTTMRLAHAIKRSIQVCVQHHVTWQTTSIVLFIESRIGPHTNTCSRETGLIHDVPWLGPLDKPKSARKQSIPFPSKMITGRKHKAADDGTKARCSPGAREQYTTRVPGDLTAEEGCWAHDLGPFSTGNSDQNLQPSQQSSTFDSSVMCRNVCVCLFACACVLLDSSAA